jgi:hypothetical protein
MQHPLEAINWRLERADEHLATLNDELDAFVKHEERSIVGHFERDTSEYVFNFGGKLPDPRLGLVVSEFAHHLRAALDNLVWQLVLLRGGSPTRRTEFPIYESRERYRRSGRGALRGVSTDDRAAIEAIQPFEYRESPSQAYLALLAWLNNVDKHRFLHVGFALPRHSAIRVSYGEEGPDAGFFPWNPRPVKDIRKIRYVHYVPTISSDDRTELARVGIEASGPDPQMEMQSNAGVDVGLSDPEHALIISDLRHMRALVNEIVDVFRPRFEVVVGAP